MKALCLIALALPCAVPALASVTVSSPVNGATVTSPFKLTAIATPCSSQSIASMGYSFDNSPTTVFAKTSSLSTSVVAPVGNHILHVKSWGPKGAACAASVAITVKLSASSGGTQTTTDLAVASPLNSATVHSPFTLAATGTLCNGQPITAMGYSVDSSSSNVIIKTQTITGSVSAAAGSHTLHIKAWGKSGSSCGTSISVTVAAPQPVITAPSIPSDAVANKDVQNLPSWGTEFDVRTTGSSTGAMQLVTSPAISGSARQFLTTYTSYAGQRYHVSLPAASNATNFVYDTQVYIANPSADLANIEMDLNQALPNGQVVIFGFQCDGWSHTWDYAENVGTATAPSAHWLHSNQTCYPQKWAGAWHHVQIQYSRDDSGNATYKSVWLDGVQQDLNVTVSSSFALHWAPSVLINLQIDGATSTAGSSTVYLDNTTIYSW